MLDLQRVKRRMEGPSSMGSIRSLSLNRFHGALGSIGVKLELEDMWGDGDPDDENDAAGLPHNAAGEVADNLDIR